MKLTSKLFCRQIESIADYVVLIMRSFAGNIRDAVN